MLDQDPDPHQMNMDPEHCSIGTSRMEIKVFYWAFIISYELFRRVSSRHVLIRPQFIKSGGGSRPSFLMDKNYKRGPLNKIFYTKNCLKFLLPSSRRILQSSTGTHAVIKKLWNFFLFFFFGVFFAFPPNPDRDPETRLKIRITATAQSNLQYRY